MPLPIADVAVGCAKVGMRVWWFVLEEHIRCHCRNGDDEKTLKRKKKKTDVSNILQTPNQNAAGTSFETAFDTLFRRNTEYTVRDTARPTHSTEPYMLHAHAQA